MPAAPDKAAPHVKAFREEPPVRQTFFRGHRDDVTCIALHPNGGLIATGEVGVGRARVTAVRICLLNYFNSHFLNVLHYFFN
jgi:hypothetical protein